MSMHVFVHVFLQLALLSSLPVPPLTPIQTTFPYKYKGANYSRVQWGENLFAQFEDKDQGPIQVEVMFVQDKTPTELTLSHGDFYIGGKQVPVEVKGKVKGKEFFFQMYWDYDQGVIQGKVGEKNIKWYLTHRETKNDQGSLTYDMRAWKKGYACQVSGTRKLEVRDVKMTLTTKCHINQSG